MKSLEEVIKYLAHDIKKLSHHLIKGEIFHLLLIGGEDHPGQKFSIVVALVIIEA